MKTIAFILALFCVAPAAAQANSVAAAGPVIPLIEATRDGDLAQVTVILASAPDAGATDSLGRTALHYAAALGHSDIIGALIAQETTPDVVDHDGFTPLMRAAQNGHLEAVRQILAGGADPSLENTTGQSALSLARAGGHQAVADLLN